MDLRVFEWIKRTAQNLQAVSAYSWRMTWGSIQESFSGAWQRNITIDPPPNLLASSAVFCCITGIAGDVAKMRIKLDRDNEGIWEEITANQPWLPVLRKPNHYQNRIKFLEGWMVSKLTDGNAYILKERRDQRGIVTALYLLDPRRVTPLVADNGDIYYELRPDPLSHLPETVTVPASEIIHDRGICLFHPLVGISPLYACALSATMANKIQANSTNQFGNASRPGGVLTAPGHISDDTAARLKAAFEANFSGANVGRLAVLGDGLKFEPMVLTAEAQQLAEQLKFTVEDVGRTFHYPTWKMGGALPPYSSGPQALTMMYYTDCLQLQIEEIEACLDEGLELPASLCTELDLENLLRMDTAALYDSNAKAIGAGFMTPNEARYRANLPPVEGGDSPMLQQQNYSLEALAKRDAQADPFASKAPVMLPAAAPQPALPPAPKGLEADDLEFFEAELTKELVLS